MERFSTKNDLERENEEAERLVRKAPKVKPPRHDKRRERVETDEDPDLKDKDKDMSMNFKDIGGSVHTAADLINVRLKNDPSKKVVQVTRETLQAEPGKYEEVKEEREEPKKPTPKKKEPKKKKEEGPTEKSDAKASESLAAMAETDPEFASVLRSFIDPSSDLFQWAKSAPETVVDKDKFLRGRTPPKEIKTMGDLQRVLFRTKLPEKGGKKKKEKGEKKEPEKPKTAPGAPERPYSEDEIKAAQDLLSQTFPPEVAVDLMLQKPPLHPDEVDEMVADYHVARSLPVPLKNIDKFRKNLKGYGTDPNKIPPPKTVEGEKGKKIPFDDLDEDKKAKAHRQHQIQSLAMNLAARDIVAKSFEKNADAPKELAGSLADFMLSGADESPGNRQERSAQKAKELFYKGLEAPELKTISPESIDKILETVKKDPSAKKVAVGYFQAVDYQDARKKFLDPKSEEHISEYQSPKEIATGLGKALNFLRERTERYPAGTTEQDTAVTFRNRVMQKLLALAPGKGPEIQDFLDKEDNRYYDEARKRFKKDLSKYKKALKRAESGFAKDYAEYTAQLKAGEDPDPPLSSEDRLAMKGVFEPREPKKPARYELHRKKPKELEVSSKQLWKSFGGRTARSRVASRYLSIYSNTSAMGRNRHAVYWGVEPAPVEPYPGWSQPKDQDLTDREFNQLLAAARDWLKTPVLTVNIEGVVRDTQLRAALDLAIRALKYDRIIHPTAYNSLLARLAGEEDPQDETLLTTAKTARNEMSEKVEFDTKTADRILARLDRIASTVQEGHEKWGMDFDHAKELVNEIDRVADDLEQAAYGEDSLTVRQAQIIEKTADEDEDKADKTAEVIQRDADEPYMNTYSNPSSPIQTEADEPYMSAYGNDDSSGVHHGKSENGRPLAP